MLMMPTVAADRPAALASIIPTARRCARYFINPLSVAIIAENSIRRKEIV
jgi:hypothetical protein